MTNKENSKILNVLNSLEKELQSAEGEYVNAEAIASAQKHLSIVKQFLAQNVSKTDSLRAEWGLRTLEPEVQPNLQSQAPAQRDKSESTVTKELRAKIQQDIAFLEPMETSEVNAMTGALKQVLLYLDMTIQDARDRARGLNNEGDPIGGDCRGKQDRSNEGQACAASKGKS